MEFPCIGQFSCLQTFAHLACRPAHSRGPGRFLLALLAVALHLFFAPVARAHPEGFSGHERSLQIWSRHLPQLPSGHQQLLFVERASRNGGVVTTLHEDTLTVDHDAVDVEIPPSAAAGAIVASSTSPARISFLSLGVKHVLTGYDHLLFLAALLLVCTSFRQAASIITFFTVAHSITLSLAALDVVHLPARIVEPAIAASIVYVGLENIFGKHRFAWRASVTFAFGLVHGLGFASALREVGLGSTGEGVALPLLKFSIGLEAGQLCIAAVLLQLLLILRKRD